MTINGFEYRSDGWYGPALDPDDQRPYTIDFTYVDTFATENISAVSWSATNATVHSNSFTSKAATVVLKQGVNGQTAVVTCSVTTSPSAYKFDRSFKVQVKAL